MATYIVLANFTDQGIKDVKETIERAADFKDMASKAGASVKDIYWTLGSRDVVAICEAPDDKAVTAFALNAAQRCSVRSETLRAFSADEMKNILDKLS